jgi:hypothetical protein
MISIYGILRIWYAFRSTQELIDSACKLVLRKELTPEQWKQFFGIITGISHKQGFLKNYRD